MLFKRGIERKNILKEIFIIEGDGGFEEVSKRGRMNRIVKISSEEFKTLFYELRVDNRLPNS
ncbi:hypothetical protein H311_01639 [Anncaliia algerae PRA109]|nr:hypothetical protein H311_01639 [Anncaliia algerae PRA109]